MRIQKSILKQGVLKSYLVNAEKVSNPNLIVVTRSVDEKKDIIHIKYEEWSSVIFSTLGAAARRKMNLEHYRKNYANIITIRGVLTNGIDDTFFADGFVDGKFFGPANSQWFSYNVWKNLPRRSISNFPIIDATGITLTNTSFDQFNKCVQLNTTIFEKNKIKEYSHCTNSDN